MKWPFRENEYVWKKTYKPEEIAGFTVCCGDLPIRYYGFDGRNLTGYNRVCVGRDGGLDFPEGFFEERRMELTAEQIDEIRAMLALIPFGELKSSDHIIELRDSGAEGFAVKQMLECRMADGKVFRYLPGGDMHPMVIMLFRGLGLLCPLPVWRAEPLKKEVPKERETMKLAVCPKCRESVIYPADYCGMCRAELGKYKEIRILSDYDDQDTVFACPSCGNIGPMYYRYCTACGNALRNW